MTSFDRVMAAINGDKLKRPPYTLTLSLYGSRLINSSCREYYTNSEKYVEGQKAVYRLLKPDIIFSPFAVSLEAAAFGTEINFTEKSPPIYKKCAVHTAKELLDLKLPNIDSNENLLYIRESTKKLSSFFNNSVPICGVVASPVDLPSLIMGIDQWIEILVTNPDSAKAIIDKTTSHFISFANKLIEDGAAFIAVPMMFINPALLFPKLIEQLIIPSIKYAFSQIKAPIIFHHGGNRIVPSLHEYLTLPNVGGFVIDSRDTLRDARVILGEGRLLLGNLNGISLSRNENKVVIQKVIKVLENSKDDHNFIFSSTGADIPWDTQPELLKEICQTICQRENL